MTEVDQRWRPRRDARRWWRRLGMAALALLTAAAVFAVGWIVVVNYLAGQRAMAVGVLALFFAFVALGGTFGRRT